MKKFIHLFFTTFLIVSIVQGQSDLVNANLDTWVQVGTFENPENWDTPNELTSLASVVVVNKDEDAYSGPYCARLETAEISFMGQTINAPGVITLGEIQQQGFTGIIIGGDTISAMPASVKGWMKYEPVDADSCVMMVFLTKWNASLNIRDTIGSGMYYHADTVSDWTEFTIDIEGQGTPDSINVIISSSDISIDLFTGKPGTVLYVDDLSLEFTSGIEYDLMPDVTIAAYPNPASGTINFSIPENLKNGDLIIFNALGQQIELLNDVSGETSLDISDRHSGVYYFHLMEGKHRISSGSFVVE